MMKRISIGLDIGASCVKMAVFENVGPKARLVGFERYDAAADGVLSDDELYGGLREFLKARNYDGAALCLGVPQYQVTTSVSDYPAARKGSLAQMVALDTTQLGGLSEESFVHGFASMPPGLGRTCPVMIALSREDSIRDCLKRHAEAALDCRELAPAGLALANACFALCKGAADSPEPALILDIGRENTLIAAVAGGQVLYVSTLMFSGSRFEDVAKAVLAERKSLNGKMTPLEYLKDIDLETESAQSRFRQAALTLESEIQNAVEHWRSQETDQLAGMPISKVYLTGGGSRMGGLKSWLENLLECAVEPFAPEDGGVPAPELSVAYGLGLQAAGTAAVSVSLVPQDVLWTRRRLRRWPWLAAAASVLVLSLLGSLLTHRVSVALRLDELKERKAVLTECLEAANSIRSASGRAADMQKTLAMLALPANRGSRIASAVKALQGGALDKSWLIYLGQPAAEAHESSQREGSFFDVPAVSAAPAFKERPDALPQEDCEFRKAPGDSEFVCAGFAPEKHRDEVASLMSALNGGTVFQAVDRANSIADTASGLVWKWREYLNGNEARLDLELKMKTEKARSYTDHFELFTLRLPFETPDCAVKDGDSDGEDGGEEE